MLPMNRHRRLARATLPRGPLALRQQQVTIPEALQRVEQWVLRLPFALHYTVSKGAVIGLTRGLARELGRDWIRVNTVSPSAVMTEGTTEFMGDKLERIKQVVASGQTLQRNLETEDLVGTIVYLASDASRFVTGQNIMVDGGTVYL